MATRPTIPQRAQAALAAADTGQAVPSPCICVCTMNARTGWCDGCLRSIDEIAAWSRMTDDGKRAVWVQLPGRAERLPMLLKGQP